MAPSRRKSSAFSAACLAFTVTLGAGANEPAVPLQLQADLTVKVLPYAEQPPLQSADFIHIAILVKPRGAESLQFASDLKAVLDRADKIGGRAHDQVIVPWLGPDALMDEVRRRKLLVLYLAPGLDNDMRDIAHALTGTQLVSVAASDSYVESGAVLGFELVSGHPKMVFNAGQAKRQNVVFRSAVMKLMRIVQ